MTTDESGSTPDNLLPDEAFALLGHETRMEVIQLLGSVDGQLSFSELRTRAGHDDPGNFRYHLNKLTGHFVRKTDEGYELGQPGVRVVEAILSGAVTEAPEMGPTKMSGSSCDLCGAPVEMSYQEEWIGLSCTECEGFYGQSGDPLPEEMETGYIGGLTLPPAGVAGREPEELISVGWTWNALEWMVGGNGICPRCSAKIDTSIQVCEDHHVDGSLCERCDTRHAVQYASSCSNCLYAGEGAAVFDLLNNTDFLEFLTSHNLNPITGTSGVYKAMIEYEEDVLSLEPFEARFTWTIDSETLTLTVTDELEVVNAERD